MFIGEYHHSMDDKGRLALPTKFRAALGEGCVVTRGIDQCLSVYALSEWQVLADKVANLPLAQEASRAFSRLMLSGAMDAKPDKQGRVLVPDYLRDYAKLGKDVVVVGLYNRLEIWSEEAWKKYKRSTEDASTAIAEKLGELGV
jgi:MraZ protein